MIVTYLRSSSYSCWKMCPWQFFLNYGLQFRSPGNIATDRGSIVHKALETIARAKLAQQNGEVSFSDPELAGELVSADVSDEDALEMAWAHYTKMTPERRWSSRDHTECNRLMRVALTSHGGAFNPRNRVIVQPEQYFDICLSEYDWAAYDFPLPDGSHLKGHLSLKGTMDLITEGYRSGVLDYLDWKTGNVRDGNLWDWAEGRVKTVDDLYEDFQLRLYFLALCRLYPDRPIIQINIAFLKKGIYTLCYDRSELPETLDRIREWFTTAKETVVPQQKVGPACNSFCHFGTTSWKDQKFIPHQDTHGNHKSICDHVWDEVQQLGTDRVVAKYSDVTRIGAYGQGGGSSNRDSK